MTILAIETSCDDTAAAVVRNGTVLSNIISSQDIHDRYGGIVPELASREHVRGIAPIVTAALHEAGTTLADIDAFAVTYGPGLPGSLLVGTHFAKGLAMRHGKPLYPIHHIEAHIYSGYLEDTSLPYPSICLVVSGGHTSIMLVRSAMDYEVLGSTKDDAAGEAFDKIAKLAGLGYPGGPHVDRLAREGRVDAFDLPRGLYHDGTFDFSFSGLKTAVRRVVERTTLAGGELNVPDLCASAQEAIIDVLVTKTMRAVDRHGVKAVVIAGGVSANSRLRERMQHEATLRNIRFVAPRMGYCVDNAAMIAHVAELRAADIRPTTSFTIAPRAIRS
jgi:N6-L-threonylcarbamoyladenine synthase